MPVCRRSAPAHERLLLIRSTWKGCGLTWMRKKSLPALAIMNLLAAMRAGSNASLDKCCHSSHTTCIADGKSSPETQHLRGPWHVGWRRKLPVRLLYNGTPQYLRRRHRVEGQPSPRQQESSLTAQHPSLRRQALEVNVPSSRETLVFDENAAASTGTTCKCASLDETPAAKRQSEIKSSRAIIAWASPFCEKAQTVDLGLGCARASPAARPPPRCPTPRDLREALRLSFGAWTG